MTRIFADDLFERHNQDPPWENLHILLDVARLRAREAHDQFEELLAILLGLGDCRRPEALQVTSNAVLFFHCEAHGDQSLEQLYRIDAGDVAHLLLLPPDAANADAIWSSGLWCDSLKGRRNHAAGLAPTELNQATLGLPFVLRPLVRHLTQIAFYLERRFRVCRIDGVWVELRRSVCRGIR